MLTSVSRLQMFSIYAACIVYPSQSIAQGVKGSDPDRPQVQFSLDNDRAVAQLRHIREVAINECVRVLDSQADGAGKADTTAASAARLLGELRPNDAGAISVLFRNLELRQKGSVSHSPFGRYVCAEALASIGGAKVTNSVVTYLKEARTRRQLLLCAHILAIVDDLPVTLERLRLAREASRQSNPADRDAQFGLNVDCIRDWLLDARFQRDETYRPE